MKKRILLIVLVVGLVLLTGYMLQAGAQPEAADPVTPPGSTLEMVLPDNDTLFAVDEALLESLKQHKGFYIFSPAEVPDFEEGFTHLIIFAGEKMTGGYTIETASIQSDGGTLKIVVKETAPDKDDMVTTAITYPYVKVQINGTFDAVEVTGETGEEFLLIEESGEKYGVGLEEELAETGLYVGQIDSNFIEITVDGEARSFALEIKSYFKGCETGEEVSFHYYEHANGTRVITRIGEK